MTYDFYGPWNENTGLHSGMYPYSSDSEYQSQYCNVQAAIENWTKAEDNDVLTYSEILEKCNNYITIWNEEQKGCYKYWRNNWLSSDEEKCIKVKAVYCK
ncbi:hypothetical protein GWI33_021028 [Rhynchophorus ferrugineus]|uniref:Uncharacterized protein n=1 Tax=Rhynchophorus ferrugineus TaxID=354439 RepID=A0A834M584_RHYFE|nr:hypothetical protein GWI33_021028 [Rhynchophorus ferrugineus]